MSSMDSKLVEDDMDGGDMLDDEKVVFRAEWLDDYVRYKMVLMTLVLVCSISGIILLPFLCLFYIGIKANAESRRLVITEKTLVFKQGFYGCCCVFWNHSSKHVPLEKVTDVTFAQGCLERKYGMATLSIQTAGQNGPNGMPELTIQGVKDAVNFRKIVMAAKSECMARTFGGGSAVSALAVPTKGSSSKYGATDDIESGSDLHEVLIRIEGHVRNIDSALAARAASSAPSDVPL